MLKINYKFKGKSLLLAFVTSVFSGGSAFAGGFGSGLYNSHVNQAHFTISLECKYESTMTQMVWPEFTISSQGNNESKESLWAIGDPEGYVGSLIFSLDIGKVQSAEESDESYVFTMAHVWPGFQQKKGYYYPAYQKEMVSENAFRVEGMTTQTIELQVPINGGAIKFSYRDDKGNLRTDSPQEISLKYEKKEKGWFKKSWAAGDTCKVVFKNIGK